MPYNREPGKLKAGIRELLNMVLEKLCNEPAEVSCTRLLCVKQRFAAMRWLACKRRDRSKSPVNLGGTA